MEDNVYEAPESEIGIISDSERVVSLYSPTQVACGVFLGGPIAVVYFLMANFSALGNEDYKRKTLHWGSALTIAFFGVLFVLPDDFPSFPLTILLIVLARQLVDGYQMKKADIIESTHHDFHSNWKVFSFSLLCLAGTLVIVVGVTLVLGLTGLIEL